jgi:hypothetical protein
MAELVHQTWTRVTGRPWSDARAGGFTTGSFEDNVALQKKLLGGWDPYAAAKPAAKATAKPAAKAATPVVPKPGTVFQVTGDAKVYLMGSDGLAHHITSGTTFDAMGFDRSSIVMIPSLTKAGISVGAKITKPPGVPVQPGLQAEQFADQLALEEFIATQLAGLEKQRIELQEQRDADARRLQEAQLGANPADFVAYELYKRNLVEQGFQPEGAIRSDADIQDLFTSALRLNEGDSLGTGQFGVELPSTQSVSRSELQGFSTTDIDILSSFLRGGVDIGQGELAGVSPADFFKELEEGLVPVLPAQRTQFIA